MTKRRRQLWHIAVVVYVLSLGVASTSWGQYRSRVTLETQAPQKISLLVGKSTIIYTPVPITRVSLASPTVADTVVISPRQLYLTGKEPGVTNLTLWEEGDRVVTTFDVEVSLDISVLKEKLREILPEEDIQVTTTQDGVTLYGNVSSTGRLAQALAIAMAFLPPKPLETTAGTFIKERERVFNLLQVTGVQQVMLEVRVAEMSRSLTRRLGLNFNILANGLTTFGLSQLSNLTTNTLFSKNQPVGDFLIVPEQTISTTISPAINAIVQFQRGNISVTGFIDALKENGLVKILAEPTLVTLSGQEARFLSGGEFPIPVTQRADTISIEFKTFGIGLVFTPTVLGVDKISLRVAPEVSALDFSNAVTTAGFRIPALTTRRAETVIELASGQSFAIAGLLNENVREVVSKFPVLGDIPILGNLFRSSAFQKNETELIIIVTPHLVKPLDLAKQTLPTDPFIEPNDLEFYLLGKMEGMDRTGGRVGKLDGKFGYIAP